MNTNSLLNGRSLSVGSGAVARRNQICFRSSGSEVLIDIDGTVICDGEVAVAKISPGVAQVIEGAIRNAIVARPETEGQPAPPETGANRRYECWVDVRENSSFVSATSYGHAAQTYWDARLDDSRVHTIRVALVDEDHPRLFTGRTKVNSWVVDEGVRENGYTHQLIFEDPE